MHEATGRTQSVSCQIDPARAEALHAVLDNEGSAPVKGEPLPPFGHLIYFWDVLSEKDLGPDGHLRIGDFIPDLGLPRRMWAGGKLEFLHPLLAGFPATKTTTIEKVARKSGRTGPLAITSLRHEIIQQGKQCITEIQDLVYLPERDASATLVKPPQARTDETSAQRLLFDAPKLFRYSAITMNGHRIHYDADYARSAEGYPGLVVHGPLLAQQLMLIAERKLGRLRHFSFRALSPLFCDEPVDFCQSENSFWVRGSDGRLCMAATAS